jgi:glutamate N-acetyltransferase/amino-acid N-acetyltransferase
MDRIEPAIDALQLDAAEGGTRFARAIMTTDTVAKSRALRIEADGRSYVIGGAAKGAGMMHPNMATMLGFLTTDAPADASWLQGALRDAVDPSFNMLDVDMDTSTSDTVLLLANGAAGGAPLREGHAAASAFRAALLQLCVELTRDLARDGEGARTLIEMTVEGAASLADARRAARTVVASPLVKTMVTGRDPNPGRVLGALGRSGATFDPARVSVRIGEHAVFEGGAVCATDLKAISQAMDAPEVRIHAHLGAGSERATAWGCDLTEGYVRINADYTT